LPKKRQREREKEGATTDNSVLSSESNMAVEVPVIPPVLWGIRKRTNGSAKWSPLME
jgi:hypothetical protein